ASKTPEALSPHPSSQGDESLAWGPVIASGYTQVKEKERMSNLNSIEERSRVGQSLHAGPTQLVRRRFSIAVSVVLALTIPFSYAAAQGSPPAPRAGVEAEVQLVQPSGPGQANPPITVTLTDALERAR